MAAFGWNPAVFFQIECPSPAPPASGGVCHSQRLWLTSRWLGGLVLLPRIEPGGPDTVKAGGCELMGGGSSGPRGEQDPGPASWGSYRHWWGCRGGKCHSGAEGRSPTTATGLGQSSECLPSFPKTEESEKVSQDTGHGDKAPDHMGAAMSHVRDILKDGPSHRKPPMGVKGDSSRAGRLARRALPQKARSTVSSLGGQGSHQI